LVSFFSFLSLHNSLIPAQKTLLGVNLFVGLDEVKSTAPSYSAAVSHKPSLNAASLTGFASQHDERSGREEEEEQKMQNPGPLFQILSHVIDGARSAVKSVEAHQVARVAAVTEAILPITGLGRGLVWLVVDLDLVGLVVELVRLVVGIVGLAVVHLVGLVGLVVDLVRGWVDHVGLVVVELGFLVGLVVDLAGLVVDLVGLVVPLVDLVVELVGLGVDHPLIVRAAAERLASECC